LVACRGPLGEVTLVHETAENVWGRIRTPASRRLICLDAFWEGVRSAARTSRFGVDRIVAGEIDFFSGLGLVE